MLVDLRSSERPVLFSFILLVDVCNRMLRITSITYIYIVYHILLPRYSARLRWGAAVANDSSTNQQVKCWYLLFPTVK